MKRVAVFFAAVFLLAACGGGSSADTPSSVTLKVGDTGWTRYKAVLDVAGLGDTPYKVEWSVFSGGDQQLQALRSNALDVTTSSEIPPIFVAVGGAPNFKVVAVQRGSTLQQELVVGKTSSITSIAQLKGKKVGYVKNTTAQYFLNELLKQSGLKWTDVDAAPLLPNDGLAALNSGAIDAFASYGNSIISAHQGGAKTIGSAENILSGNFLWAASDALLADSAKKAALVDLLSRIDKAYAFVRNGHERQFAEATANGTHQPVGDALSQIHQQEQQRPTQLSTTSPDAIASEQRVADSFTEINALPKKLDVSAYWTDALNADLGKALTK
ncbi:MAG TPA: ABC transporter substrate-binding protein [Amycolatopsis sp.]|uniref:ABC transporter substrate-binding protein n=1 Tax=Amycolatopsis sp. TaxID=37632 RepID=UPI002B4919E3|nr:ABC transporter substrate-binding protein [Amycolatopsis sp.]HKS47348.1 ABC transporter substrate-binding protein [Amycolatopsis sp.]